MTVRRFVFAVSAIGIMVASFGVVPASADSIPVLDDSQTQPLTETFGGADPVPGATTVPHWFASANNPHNNVTYGYNMVGANPALHTTTIVQADITPLNVVVGGRLFSGSDVLAATLGSPLFGTNDYGSTSAATQQGTWPPDPTGVKPFLIQGPGGAVSQNDAGNQLQLEDATMRAQFGQTGNSTYHVLLNPNVLAAVTIVVPSSDGILFKNSRGIVWANVDIKWWATRIQSLNSTADPTHLPIWLTNDVYLRTDDNPLHCCVIGFHGASEVNGRGGGSVHGNGAQPIQTYAWATFISPGRYVRFNGSDWAVQDIHGLSHEISEWADDPFTNNTVEPWKTPSAPQYGCSGLLETGDPVVGIGFAIGHNTFEQSKFGADGAWHPEDEVFLPWFMRTPANAAASEPTQSNTGGRYTLMGDLNPFPGFRTTATGC